MTKMMFILVEMNFTVENQVTTVRWRSSPPGNCAGCIKHAKHIYLIKLKAISVMPHSIIAMTLKMPPVSLFEQIQMSTFVS